MTEIMMKTIGFMPRKPGTTRAAFREHYENVHAPLALKYFPFCRYRRNYLTDAGAEPGYDSVSEFWSGPASETEDLMSGDVGKIMRSDERSFTDQPRITPAYANPVATGSDAASQLFLLRRIDGHDGELIEMALSAGAGLDLLTQMGANPLPADAILRLAGEPPALPRGWSAIHRLTVDIVETPASELLGDRHGS